MTQVSRRYPQETHEIEDQLEGECEETNKDYEPIDRLEDVFFGLTPDYLLMKVPS